MRALLAAAWLASCVGAFQFGRGKRSDRSETPVPVAGDGGEPAASVPPEARRDLLNETRRLGVGRRFVDYTREFDGDTLARLLPEMVGKMEETQIRELLVSVIEEIDPSPSTMLAEIQLVGRWAQLDAGAAFEYIDSSTNPKLRHDMKRHAIRAWAAADPGAAFAYLDEAEELPTASSEAFWKGFAAPLDLRASLDFVPELIDGDEDRGFSRAVAALFRHDGESVTGWAGKLPQGEVRDKALLGVAGEWARHDPDAARSWIEKHASAASLDEALERLASVEPERTDPKAIRRFPVGDP